MRTTGGGPDPVGPGSRTLLLLLVLTAVCVLAVDARGGRTPVDDLRQAVATVLAPAQEVVRAASAPVLDLVAERDAARLAERDARVAALEDELAGLRAAVRTAERDRSRAAELDRLLGVVGAAGYATVPAQVVATGPAQAPGRSVTIDAGTLDGVGLDMTVLSGAGLVGRVVAVSATSATVQLLVDPAVRVGARLAGSSQLGLASGEGSAGRPDRLRFELLDPLEPMADGDVVLTFGSPGGRPYVPGVPIGELVDVSAAYGASARTATLVPYVDFSALDLVGVVVEPPRTDPRDVLVPMPVSTLDPSPAPSVRP